LDVKTIWCGWEGGRVPNKCHGQKGKRAWGTKALKARVERPEKKWGGARQNKAAWGCARTKSSAGVQPEKFNTHEDAGNFVRLRSHQEKDVKKCGEFQMENAIEVKTRTQRQTKPLHGGQLQKGWTGARRGSCPKRRHDGRGEKTLWIGHALGGERTSPKK